jgi:mono/diheme cytochrome c family protein
MYRPMGLAMGPDGSLYISDSEKGKIWRVMYKGDKAKFGEAQLAEMATIKKKATNIKIPDEIADNLDKGNVNAGGRLYNTYCGVCHQRDGMGNDRFPPLSGSEWVTGNKMVPISIILNGLEGELHVKGKMYNNKMPRLHLLSDGTIAEIVTYIRQNFNNNASAVSTEDVLKTRKELSSK